jgi:hypothetical protein
MVERRHSVSGIDGASRGRERQKDHSHAHVKPPAELRAALTGFSLSKWLRE